VDEGVVVGAESVLGPHVHLTGRSVIGSKNQIHTGAVIGDLPQDLRFTGGQTRVVIGDANVIREHVTIHRSNKPDEDTTIGSHNFLMAHSHVGHNAHIGDNVIIANGALLGGHVVVQDRAFISGNCLVHQFTRVGALALMRGGSAISKDLPPFCISRGENSLAGLNTVGMRRAGISPDERLELKRVYHFLFRAGRNIRAAAEEALNLFQSTSAQAMLRFIAEAKRGILTLSSRRSAPEEEEEAPSLRG
jgi:UDP-N-acetylglucosamine acyltransferase